MNSLPVSMVGFFWGLILIKCECQVLIEKKRTKIFQGAEVHSHHLHEVTVDKDGLVKLLQVHIGYM